MTQVPLDFTISGCSFWETSATDCVDLVHKDNARLMISGVVEHLSDKSGWLSDIFVDNSWWDDLQSDLLRVELIKESLLLGNLHQADLPPLELAVFFRFQEDHIEDNLEIVLISLEFKECAIKPFGGEIPTRWKSSGLLRGSSMTSLSSRTWSERPPISE